MQGHRRRPPTKASNTRGFEEAAGAPSLPQAVAADLKTPSNPAKTSKLESEGTRSLAGVPRSEAARNPYDRDLSDLVGELSTQSEEFRTRWAAHNVRFHITGVKHFHHPVVGELSLTYDRMELPADPGLTIFTYTAEPGSKSAQALNLLGSWAATPAQPEPAHATDEA
jgi:hypothetical protein